MANTVAEAVTRLRVRLQESSASEWQDSGQLNQYVGDAEQWLADLIGKLPGSGKYRVIDYVTLAASTETFSLATGTNPTALTKTLAEVVEVSMQVENGRYVSLLPLRDGEDSYFRGSTSTTTGGIVLPRYRLLDEAFQFLPLSTASRALKIESRYIPTIKTSGTLETPEREMNALVTRAAHFALADAGETNKPFEDEHAVLVAEIEARWGQREFGARTETVRRRTARVLFK